MKKQGAHVNQGIALRLRQFREQLKISRTSFALEIGIGSERLASYESARAPLRWGVFSAISNHFFLNPFWLATGKSVPQLESAFDESRFESIDPRKLFQEVMLDTVNEAGSTQEYETTEKISRLYRSLIEIANIVNKNKITPEVAAHLHELLTAARKLGIIFAGKTKANMRKREEWMRVKTPH